MQDAELLLGVTHTCFCFDSASLVQICELEKGKLVEMGQLNHGDQTSFPEIEIMKSRQRQVTISISTSTTFTIFTSINIAITFTITIFSISKKSPRLRITRKMICIHSSISCLVIRIQYAVTSYHLPASFGLTKSERKYERKNITVSLGCHNETANCNNSCWLLQTSDSPVLETNQDPSRISLTPTPSCPAACCALRAEALPLQRDSGQRRGIVLYQIFTFPAYCKPLL